MKRMKVLGLALVAVFAMSAVGASAASAANFMSEGNVEGNVEANQSTTHVFSIEGNDVTCTTAKFVSGVVASPTASVKVHPTYTGCTAFGFVGSTVTTTGCDYNLTAPGTVEGGKVAGNIAVECSAGSKIVIVAGTCEVTVAAQSFTKGLTFENVASTPKTLTLKAAVTGISSTKVKDGFLCPLSGTGAASGTYTGNTLVKGFQGATQIGVTVE
ncbi:MAG TPA: hypothetical protein VMS60_06885 [Solirubrobacterales bacterium]|nr:hypothetical protein [Solirubrobacterales bacterium]